MSFRWRHRVLGKLSLSPVFLDHVTACCLVSMAAFEARRSEQGARRLRGVAAAIISITNVISSVCTVLQTFKNNGSNK